MNDRSEPASPSRPEGTFVYSNPPIIHWGAGCVGERLDSELQARNARRVFLVTTRSVATSAELGGAVRGLLGERLVGEYAGIGQHVPVRSVAEAAKAAREARPDILLSLGGGSPIDATKSVAFSLASGIDLASPSVKDARVLGALRTSPLPHLSIPTTLSAAELSGMAGFSIEGTREKTALSSSKLVPSAVFYDPALTVPTPLTLWLSSGIRAIDHAVEGILAPGNHPFSDTLGLESLRRLHRGLLATHLNPSDLEARVDCQIGAWFSFTLPGPAASGLSHALGKRLGSRHAIPHGITSCLLLPHVMRYLAPRTRERQARLASALNVDTHGMDPDQAAAASADAVARLIADLDLPTHLGEYGLSDRDLEEAVLPLVSQQQPAERLLAILRAAR